MPPHRLQPSRPPVLPQSRTITSPHHLPRHATPHLAKTRTLSLLRSRALTVLRAAVAPVQQWALAQSPAPRQSPHSATPSPARPPSRLPIPMNPHLKMTQMTGNSQMTTNYLRLRKVRSMLSNTPRCQGQVTNWFPEAQKLVVRARAGKKANSTFDPSHHPHLCS